jgi:protein-serine/threonine kinase
VRIAGSLGSEPLSTHSTDGVCEKAAIGKGATAVVRLAHKWDKNNERLYAVKVRRGSA